MVYRFKMLINTISKAQILKIFFGIKNKKI